MNQMRYFLLFIFVVLSSSQLIGQALFLCENDNNGNRIMARQLSSIPGGSSGFLVLHESESSAVGPHSMAIDNVNQKIYWVNLEEGTLNRSDLNGMEKEILIADDYQPFDLILASSLNKIIWTDLDGKLFQSNADGTNIELIPTDENSFATQLSFHEGLAMLYWSEGNSIKSLDLNSNAIEVVISISGGSINDHAIDELNGKILWTDENSGTLKRSNLDGSETELLHNGIEGKKPFSVTVDPENYRMFWSESDSLNSTLWRGDVWGSSRLRIGTLTGGKYWEIELSTDDVVNTFESQYEVSELTIFPNPTSDIVNITYEERFLDDHFFVEVVDVLGRPLFRRPLTKDLTQIDLSTLDYGDYFILLKVDEKIILSKKVLKL